MKANAVDRPQGVAVTFASLLSVLLTVILSHALWLASDLLSDSALGWATIVSGTLVTICQVVALLGLVYSLWRLIGASTRRTAPGALFATLINPFVALVVAPAIPADWELSKQMIWYALLVGVMVVVWLLSDRPYQYAEQLKQAAEQRDDDAEPGVQGE